ncbi:MAG: hypothetical protein Q4F40_00815 [Akkermansia sp.]|nr:hypothetical protein [Akkermansia sp.]
MKNRKLIRRLCICAILLLSSGLISCISLYPGRFTIIDTGGAIAAIGQERPQLRADPLPPQKKASESAYRKQNCDLHYRVWKKGEKYIVEIPVAYAPVRYSVLLHTTRYYGPEHKSLRCELPSEQFTQEELRAYPAEYLYAELDKMTYRRLCTMHKLREHRIPKNSLTSNPDLSNAELIVDVHGYPLDGAAPGHPTLRGNIDPHRMPARRTWYNYCLMPLSWAGEVADIPLSLIATPIGWVVDAIYEPLAN